jgi:hypothetical protein
MPTYPADTAAAAGSDEAAEKGGFRFRDCGNRKLGGDVIDAPAVVGSSIAGPPYRPQEGLVERTYIDSGTVVATIRHGAKKAEQSVVRRVAQNFGVGTRNAERT